MIRTVFVPAIALVFDKVVGDPRVGWHPVVLIGQLILYLEKWLRRPGLSPWLARVAGLVLVIVVLTITYNLVGWLVAVLTAIHPWVGYVGQCIFLSFTLSPRSLAQAGQEIKAALEAGDIKHARSKVSWIVGRDTHQLEQGEIVRATVETIAENMVDGVIAPLFYGFIGGCQLAFLYRAVNTLDSMVGYKNSTYEDFGKVAARVDDVCNYLPARLTGIFLVPAAAMLGYHWAGAIRSIWRDAGKHPSPNSGIPEAGVAGALGIRLGGLNYYGGVASFRAYMGEPTQEIQPEDISRTNKLLYAVTALFIIFGTGWSWWWTVV